MDIQLQLDKAAEFKKIAVFEQDRINRKSDTRLIKACVSYEKIYQRLVKDCAKNGWNLWDFKIDTSYFDFETFSGDVLELKNLTK